MPLPSFIRRIRRAEPIIVVSGLPRSGTSMMMRMLAAGGVPILADSARGPDASNPTGYFEFAPVKHLANGDSPRWLHQAQGKAVKIVSFLLTWLPEAYDYRVLFMRRDLEEVVASQLAMLAARGEPAGADAAKLASVYAGHLEEVGRFLGRRRCFRVLDVDHRDVIDRPEEWATRVAQFLDRNLPTVQMAAAVEPALYRQRHG